MTLSKMIEDYIERLETRYQELNNEWDKLDSHGNQVEKQQKIAQEMCSIKEIIEQQRNILEIVRRG